MNPFWNGEEVQKNREMQVCIWKVYDMHSATSQDDLERIYYLVDYGLHIETL